MGNDRNALSIRADESDDDELLINPLNDSVDFGEAPVDLRRSSTLDHDCPSHRNAVEAAIYLIEGELNELFSLFHPRTRTQRQYFQLVTRLWFQLLDFGVGLTLLLIVVVEEPAVWRVPEALGQSIVAVCVVRCRILLRAC
jgi:hypothetical protein